MSRPLLAALVLTITACSYDERGLCVDDVCLKSDGSGALALDVAAFETNTASITLSGTCAASGRVFVRGATAAAVDCVSGRFTTDVTVDADGSYAFEVVQAGTIAPATWTRDTTPPSFEAQTSLSGGGSVSTRRYAALTTRITDATTSVTAVCLKVADDAAPDPSDGCWVPLGAGVIATAPGPDVTLDNLPAELGFTADDYRVRLWARDRVSNVSGAPATQGRDLLDVTYSPSEPPVMADVVATTVDIPAIPPTQAQLTVDSGGKVFIRWKASDAQALPANPISIYYTTTDVTYTAIATGLTNASNSDGECSVGIGQGCYVWDNAPENVYLRVRVVVENSQGYRTGATAPPLNVWPLSIIAGNFDAGTDLSATSAMFFSVTKYASVNDPGELVMTRDGTIYFRDAERGVLSVNPRDGLLHVLLPTTGAASPDGRLATATARDPQSILLDSQERLYVFDYDRLRRIDIHAANPTVTTVLGGGASTSDGVGPLDVKIALSTTYTGGRSRHFVVLPNGNIWFQSDTSTSNPGQRIRVYEPTTGVVRSIQPHGSGDGISSSVNIAACLFNGWYLGYDPATSAETDIILTMRHGDGLAGCDGSSDFFYVAANPANGDPRGITSVLPNFGFNYRQAAAVDGQIYAFARYSDGIWRYDTSARAWTQIAGTHGAGDCDDGTLFSECPLDLQDVFLDATSRIRFVQRGRIRTVDRDNRVQTIAGQGTSYGDGVLPTTARFGQLDNVRARYAGYLVLDHGNGTFRQVDAAVVTKVAGNGSIGTPRTAVSATLEPLLNSTNGLFWSQFDVDASNAIYFQRTSSKIGKLSGGVWSDIIGNDAATGTFPIDDPSSNGKAGALVNFTKSTTFNIQPPLVFGIDSSNTILMCHMRSAIPSFDPEYSWMKTYAGTTWTQSAFAGTSGPPAYDWCAQNTNLDACTWSECQDLAIPAAKAGKWYFARKNDTRVKGVARSDGTMSADAFTTNDPINAFNFDKTTPARVYYCTSDGNFVVRESDGTESTAAWNKLPDTILCVGDGFAVSTTEVVFPIRSGLMFGLARLKL